MKTLLIILLTLLFIISTSCVTVRNKNQVNYQWMTGYELRQCYGKEKAQIIMKMAVQQNTVNHKTYRLNIRKDVIEYNIEAIQNKPYNLK